MKITSKKLLATILLLAIAALPVHAQTNDSKEVETVNAVEAIPTTPAVTNDALVENEEPSVRIDSSGIHVGGKNPVDIGIPQGIHHGSPVALWIPIIAILMVFGMPIAIVGIFFYFRHRKTKMLHETLRAMVEKGVAIPSELFTATGAARPPSSSSLPPPTPGAQGSSAPPVIRRHKDDLRNGLIMTGVGIGVTAFVGRVGLIILFIGVAMIVSAFIERRDRNSLPPENK